MADNTNYAQIGGVNIPVIPAHLGGTAVVPNGGTATVTLPAGTRSAWLVASGGAGYYSVNGNAGTTGPGYVPQDTHWIIPMIANLDTLTVFAAAGVTVFIEFYTG